MSRDLERGNTLKGVFYDSPVQGLEYKTQSISGKTNKNGEFNYCSGETVTFSVGATVLGSAPGKERITPADLDLKVCGDVDRIKNIKVTNIARFIQSLDEDGDVENGITITGEANDTVKRYRYKIKFDQTEEEFTEDANIKALFAELKLTLRTAAQARNHLRRTLYGIKKITDVKIPMRDGSYLMADVFGPIDDGKYPAIVAFGGYGKAFYRASICSEEDMLKHEEMEDKYFEGNPDNLPSERWELANTVDWIPRGYVMVTVDERGCGKSPGPMEMFSVQVSEDYYDAIEWSAKQSWCSGNVGIWGQGYYAMTAMQVAQLQPPSLKAMIPIGITVDSYRDYIFIGGGLYNTFNFLAKTSCGEWDGVDWLSIAKANPFNDPAIYGPNGKINISPDLSKVKVPFWDLLGLEGTLYTRGCSEAYIHAASKDKKLTILSEAGTHFESYTKEYLERDIAFMDYWLKGIDNGIMDEPPVKMMVRTGGDSYYWQDENEWPIARTQYTKYYLDVSPSTCAGDGKRSEFLRLDIALPKEDKTSTYSADVEWSPDNAWSHGVSFVTEPMPEDTMLAGYLKLGIWVSSTTHDMELHASVRVMDGNNVEVPYTFTGEPNTLVGSTNATVGRLFPVAFGALKVSHRKLDPEKSTDYRPYHTHLEKDYQPLKPGEAVEAEVEFWPTTAMVKKGHRIRLDVQPATGSGIPYRIYDEMDQTYQRGASNTIYTGPGHSSYLRLPVIPPK